MQIFKSRWFRRFATKEGIADSLLAEAGTRAFFVYGFAKSHRANIDSEEKRQFKAAAKHMLALTEQQLAELLLNGDFVEVKSE